MGEERKPLIDRTAEIFEILIRFKGWDEDDSPSRS